LSVTPNGGKGGEASGNNVIGVTYNDPRPNIPCFQISKEKEHRHVPFHLRYCRLPVACWASPARPSPRSNTDIRNGINAAADDQRIALVAIQITRRAKTR
jgi:hypothetical protein